MGINRASLRFGKRLNFSIIPRKLSIFYRSFSNQSSYLLDHLDGEGGGFSDSGFFYQFSIFTDLGFIVS